MAGKLIKAIVAPRKTLMYGGKYVGSGIEVSLPAEEVAELQKLGFLVDSSSAPLPATGQGPVFEQALTTTGI